MYDYESAVAHWPPLSEESRVRLAELLRPGVRRKPAPSTALGDRVNRLLARMTGPDPWTEPDITTTERPGAEPKPPPEPEEGE